MQHTLNLLLSLVLLAGATACKKSGSSSTPPVQAQAIVIDVAVDRMSGPTDGLFALSANVLATRHTIASFDWDFGDGRVASGDNVTASWPQPGLYSVTLTAEDDQGNVQTAGVALTVFAAAGTSTVSPGGSPLPPLLGDVDGDGTVTLADAHYAIKHVADLVRITDLAALLAADMDLDGEIDREDVELISLAVAAGGIPEQLAPTTGAPGVLVNLVSKHLMDPDKLTTVKVGNAPAIEPFRPMLGRATFTVPLRVQNVDPFAPITAGRIAIAILQDGVEVASFPFDLVPPQQGAGDPIQETVGAIQTLATNLNTQAQNLSAWATEVGATPDESALILSLLEQAKVEFDTAAAQMGAALAALPADAQRGFGLAANANGLQDLLQSLATANAEISYQDSLVDFICGFQTFTGYAGKIDNVVGSACAVIQVGALVPGPQQPILAGVATLCAGLTIGNDILNLIKDFVPSPGKNLAVVADRNQLQPNEVATLEIRIRLSLAESICVGGLGRIEEIFKKKLTVTLLKRLPIAKVAFQVLKRYPLDQRKAIRAQFLDKVSKSFDSLIGKALSITGINDLLGTLRQKVCSYIPTGSGYVNLDWQNGVLLPPSPATAGVIVSPPSSSLPPLFQCDANLTQSVVVTLSAQRKVCGKVLTGSTKITCGPTSGVTICMGDNGSLLDDIFEVVVDGQSVLTSSAPVRNICTSLNLTQGSHTVQMIGRAAPDGVGTYFITFTGASVTSGPPLSGSNLSAGTVFTWTINVGGV